MSRENDTASGRPTAFPSFDPRLERRTRALASLDLADPWTAQPDPPPELDLSQPPPSSSRPEVAAERTGDRGRFDRAFDLDLGAPMSVHAAPTITYGANRAINRPRGHVRTVSARDLSVATGARRP